MAVSSSRKVFDLSSLFTSSAEPAKTAQPSNNVFKSKPQIVHEYANQLSKVEKRGNDCSKCPSLTSYTGISVRNTHLMSENQTKSCVEPSRLVTSSVIGGGESSDGCQSRSLHSNNLSGCENLSNSAFQNMQSVYSKPDHNLEYNIVQKGNLSSRIELKLAHPTQWGWSPGSTTLSTTSPDTWGSQTTTFQEQVTPNLGSSKAIENYAHCLHCQSTSDFQSNKNEIQLGLLDARSRANGACHVEQLKDVLCNSSDVLMPITPNTSAGRRSVMKTNESIKSYHLIPEAFHSQPHVDRLHMDFSCDEGTGLIRSLNANKLAFQKSKISTKDARCENNYSTVGRESSFRLYVRQMDNSGSFHKTGNSCQFNSSTVPSEKFSSLQRANMLPDVFCAAKHRGNVGSPGTTLATDGIGSSRQFGTNQRPPSTSSGLTPVAVILQPNLDPASFYKELDAVNPNSSNRNSRSLALRNADKTLLEKAVDASCQLDQIDSDKGQKSKACTIFDSRMQGMFPDPGSSGENREHPFNLGQNTKTAFLHASGGQKVHNSKKVIKTEGANNWEHLKVCSCLSVSNSEVIYKCYQGLCAHQPATQPSLSLGRGENKASGCNMLQRCPAGSCTYVSGMCHCTIQTVHPNRECESKRRCVINNLKKQATMEVVRDPELVGSKVGDYSVSTVKATWEDCSRKLKERLDVQLERLDSPWIDVPSKVNAVTYLRSTNEPKKLSDKIGEADIHFGEIGGNAISAFDQVTDLKGKKWSNLSSGYSEPAVTQASIEVNKSGSYSVDDDTVYTDDQIADQESTIDKSWSSADAIDSVRSSQSVYSGKGTEEESLPVLPNEGHHCLTNEFNERHSKSEDVKRLGYPEASFGEVFNAQNPNNQSNFRKRKHRKKGNTLGTSLAVEEVSFLTSEFPANASKADATDNVYTSEDVEVLPSKQGSDNMVATDLGVHAVKRRRAGPSSVKMPSFRSDVNQTYDVFEDEFDEHRPVKDSDDLFANAEYVAKRLKQVKPTESVVKQTKFAADSKKFWFYNPTYDESSEYSLKCCQKATFVSDENGGVQEVKPVACGMYGILCNLDLDLDQIKPPKIVPLSQVLKSSKRVANCKNGCSPPSMRGVDQLTGGSKCIYEFVSFSKGQDSESNFLCTGGDHDNCNNETLETNRSKYRTVFDDLSFLEEVEASGKKRKSSVSSRHAIAQSKPREIRVRSLYELPVKGRKFNLTNASLSKTLMCTSSTEYESERKSSEHTGKIDGSKCRAGFCRCVERPTCKSLAAELDSLCCVCGVSTTDDTNCLLECGHCSILIHQACYGISRVPKGDWYCRPCRTGSKDVACVLCGYGGGAMTRAFGSRNIVKSLLKAWNIQSKLHTSSFGSPEVICAPAKMQFPNKVGSAIFQPSSSVKPGVHNSIVSGLFDRTVKQWVHMVCGLWTPGSRCPNVGTMSAFDVCGVSHPKLLMVCYICKRRGGSCIKCHVDACNTFFHPWCAHQKGLLQSEVEDVGNHKIDYYGECSLHANLQSYALESNIDTDMNDYKTEQGEPTCARTEGYKGKVKQCEKHSSHQNTGKSGSLVSPVQVDAWLHINRRKSKLKRLSAPPASHADHDYRKEYARYKQAKGWKQLVVYKSGIHALGLYTSQFIPHGAVVVEYVGEIVGLRVSDKRELEYLSGRRLQYKGACYFFKIDKEHIIDATCKGGIARFVNHSCQPNCVAKVISVRSEKKVVFFAQRDIYPGEEVTYDYNFNHEDEGKKIPCLCNSKNCRRYLN